MRPLILLFFAGASFCLGALTYLTVATSVTIALALDEGMYDLIANGSRLVMLGGPFVFVAGAIVLAVAADREGRRPPDE